MITCATCGRTSSDGTPFCSQCGSGLSGGDSALERLIDERARAILAEEREAAAREREKATFEESQSLARQDLASRVDLARERLRTNVNEPASLAGSLIRSMKRVALAALAFCLFPGSGMLVHMFLIPAFGTSPAGLVCPLVCDDCSAPARTFSWNFEGSWESKNGRMGYAFVCHNPRIDVSTLAASDIVQDPLNTELQPYMLSSFTAWMAESAICVPLIALFLGTILGTRRRNRALDARPGLEASLAEAEGALRAFDQRQRDASEGQPYR